MVLKGIHTESTPHSPLTTSKDSAEAILDCLDTTLPKGPKYLRSNHSGPIAAIV